MKDSLKYVLVSEDYIELKPLHGLVINLKYASTDNFVGQNLYGDFNRAFLHRVAAEMLLNAVKNLAATKPTYKIIIFDALRPRSAQYLLWNKVKNTPQEIYVANPEGGSVHNFGFAVDLSIVDGKGNELDMGTPYDTFNDLAQPQLEERFLNEGKLTAQQIENRLLLRHAMEKAGFIQLPFEWWHFDALPKAEVKAKFKIVE